MQIYVRKLQRASKGWKANYQTITNNMFANLYILKTFQVGGTILKFWCKLFKIYTLKYTCIAKTTSFNENAG